MRTREQDRGAKLEPGAVERLERAAGASLHLEGQRLWWHVKDGRRRAAWATAIGSVLAWVALGLLAVVVPQPGYGIPTAVVMPVLAYAALHRLNRAQVKVTGRNMTVTEGPLPPWRRRRFDASELTAVFWGEWKSRLDAASRYIVYAQLKNGERHVVVDSLPSAALAQSLVLELQHRLDLKTAVEGQVPFPFRIDEDRLWWWTGDLWSIFTPLAWTCISLTSQSLVKNGPIAVALSNSVLRKGLDRTRVAVADRVVTISEGPFPPFKTRRFDARELTALFCRKWESRFAVFALRKDGESQLIVDRLPTLAAAKSLELELERQLDLLDIPVAGELPQEP